MWHLEDNQARLELPQFAATVSLTAPKKVLGVAAGLTTLAAQQRPLADGLILSVHYGTPSAPHSRELYCRGDHLVATYAETSEWPYRAQLYWRATANRLPRAIAAIELIASLQTRLLDARAELDVFSILRADEVLRLGDAATGEFASVSST